VIFFAHRDRDTRIKNSLKVTTSRTRVVVFREKIIPQNTEQTEVYIHSIGIPSDRGTENARNFDQAHSTEETSLECRTEPFRKREKHRKFLILFRTIPQKMKMLWIPSKLLIPQKRKTLEFRSELLTRKKNFWKIVPKNNGTTYKKHCIVFSSMLAIAFALV
jgi:hypothetical protein